jgi:NADH:ubiquinone oxidoreductase subunit E
MSKEIQTGGGRSQLLPALKAGQQENGHLSLQVMAGVAGRLGLPLNEVYGVATFYAFLPVAPAGKYIIRVCRCLPCDLKDGPAIVNSLQQQLGIAPGQVTPDGKFSLELVSCIGACDQAPAMLINDKLYGNLKPQGIAEILKSY